MKKIYFIMFILLIIPINVHAEKTKLKLDKCIDGDTISVIINNEKRKVRFLAVDAPEIDKEELYSEEAKDFTCNILKNAKKIYIEKDKNADEIDKYDRLLGWIWADDILVQKELVENGYAKVAYLYDKYKYIDDLKEYENNAKKNKLNIWSEYKKDYQKKENAKTKKTKKDVFLQRLNDSYQYVVAVVAGILALITYYIRRKK